MWKQRSEILAHLTKLMSTKNPWKWTGKEKNAFDQLIVHTDHENLTYKHINSDRVMRWRLYIEEYSPNLCYIKGTKNVVADALSRLGILNSPMNAAHFTEALCSELYAFDDEGLLVTAFPLSYAFLGKAQSTDVAILKEIAKTKSFYSIQPFTGVGKTR
jgi:hypothetical protein